MRLERMTNGDLKVITRKGNIYIAVDLHDGTYNIWDEQRQEMVMRTVTVQDFFEVIYYREYSLNYGGFIMKIQQALNMKFVEILARHNNPVWARRELEWLVYDKYKTLYELLSEEEKKEVDDYMTALTKIHGGN